MRTFVFGNLLLPGESIIRVQGTEELFMPVLLELHRLGYLFLYKE